MTPAAPIPEAATTPGRRRPSRARLVKVVRRVHLYAGLLLMPWVLFFGLSGLVFNHPNFGDPVQGRFLSPDEVAEHSSLAPRDPADGARAVLEALASAEGGGAYELDPGFSPHFEGWPMLTAKGDGVSYMVIANLGAGGVLLTTRPDEAEIEYAPFAGTRVDVPGYRMEDVQADLEPLLESLAMEAQGPLRVHPKASPRLWFRVRDAEGRAFNAVYDLAHGTLSGRPVDGESGYDGKRLLTKLHTTHHFPMEFGSTFIWVLLADLTALLLLVWAVSGLVMWLQLKKQRRVGVIMLVVSIVGAGALWVAMTDQIEFAGAGGPRGPGG